MGSEFFQSNFNVEKENGVLTKIGFLAIDFLFTDSNFTLISTVFFLLFFGFDQIFITRWWFFVYLRHFALIFCFFF